MRVGSESRIAASETDALLASYGHLRGHRKSERRAMLRRLFTMAAIIAVVAFSVVGIGAAGATGQPNQSCEETPTTPGLSSSAPGSPSTPTGLPARICGRTSPEQQEPGFRVPVRRRLFPSAGALASSPDSHSPGWAEGSKAFSPTQRLTPAPLANRYMAQALDPGGGAAGANVALRVLDAVDPLVEVSAITAVDTVIQKSKTARAGRRRRTEGIILPLPSRPRRRRLRRKGRDRLRTTGHSDQFAGHATLGVPTLVGAAVPRTRAQRWVPLSGVPKTVKPRALRFSVQAVGATKSAKVTRRSRPASRPDASQSRSCGCPHTWRTTPVVSRDIPTKLCNPEVVRARRRASSVMRSFI